MWVDNLVWHAHGAMATIVTGLCSLSRARSDYNLLYPCATYYRMSTSNHAEFFFTFQLFTSFATYLYQKDEGQTGDRTELRSADKNKETTHEADRGAARLY